MKCGANRHTLQPVQAIVCFLVDFCRKRCRLTPECAILYILIIAYRLSEILTTKERSDTMKKTGFRLTVMIALTLSLVLIMSAAAFAAPTTKNIKIITPKNKTVYYVGEKVSYKARCDNPNEFGGDILVWLKKNSNKKTVWGPKIDDYSFADYQTPGTYVNGKFSTKKMAAGNCTFYVKMDLYSRYDEEAEIEGHPYPVTRYKETASAVIVLKKLKAPAKLKVKAGKRKVTIRYKKATGAKKYEIFRSTKKKKGYKKIATTKKTKYVDKKKLRKKKKYYYKVRSARTGKGKVKSAFSGRKRSGKVK